MSLFPDRKPTGIWWRDHGLSLVLTGIMAVQLILVFGAGWFRYSGDQKMHNQPVLVSDYIVNVALYELPLSLVADTYGVLLVVLLTKYLRERGSAESN